VSELAIVADGDVDIGMAAPTWSRAERDPEARVLHHRLDLVDRVEALDEALGAPPRSSTPRSTTRRP
jgi:hypothetical protein